MISVGEALEKSPLFREACERIGDMLRQDDGEAFFEAEKFLKREARDLYDKIGKTRIVVMTREEYAK